MPQLRKILLGLWRGLDVLRKCLHLLLLLMVFSALMGIIRGSVPIIPSRAALLLEPKGEIVEQLTGDPLQRVLNDTSETLLWDMTAAIRAAARDHRIPAIAIDVDHLDAAGQPVLEELSRALKEFRATGKKVIAYGVDLNQVRYYLAAQADEVYLDPLGSITIEGYERYQMYFKQALEKLGIDMNIFRVGQYKSAVEPYQRSDMSPEDREESLSYLNAQWSSYQEAVTRARKLPADALAKYVGSLAKTMTASRGDAAQVALQANLITGIKTRIEFERRLIDLVGADDSTGSFESVTVNDYAQSVHDQSRLAAAGHPHVGVIVASGEVMDGEQAPGTIGGDSLSRLIRQARMDRNIRAVVLRVNSPGGSVTASEQIYRELVALRSAGKPLIVSMSNLAASGGYYISAPADEIWASPTTLTGSIGIFSVVPTLDKTLNKLGVSVDGVGTTPLSGDGSLFRPLGETARALIQAQVDHGYDVFLQRVSSGRRKSTEQVDAIGRGRVWVGRDAIEKGLVDKLGSFEDAVKAAARRANLHDDYAVEFVEPEVNWVQRLVMQMRGSMLRMALHADRGTLSLTQVAQTLDPVTREMDRLSRFTHNRHLYAYCFCSLQ